MTGHKKTREILVIDDSNENRDLMSKVLETLGTVASTCPSGFDSLPLVENRLKSGSPFDMILVDIRMPKMNGYETSRQLREKGYKGPIVAFTSGATMIGKKESQAVGITAYFNKCTISAKLIEALIDAYIPSSN